MNTTTVVSSREIHALRKRLYIHEHCTVENTCHSFCIWLADLFVQYFVNFTFSLSSNSCTTESATERGKPQIRIYRVFSSPELKAQVSFSDHLSSGVYLSVRPSVRLSVCKLFTFSSSSPEWLGQFQPNLAQSILGWRGFKFVQMKGPALFQGEIITK